MREHFAAAQMVVVRARNLFAREEGQAAVEYGVLLALILVVALAFIPGVGTALANAYSKIESAITGAGI